MADLGFGPSGFDATAPENQRTNSVVPAGEYPAIMVESEKVQTKSGDGSYLKTKWQIVKGEFQNRIIFKNFNLWLPAQKEQALTIARGEFSEFCRAVGVPSPKDSSELHNKVCMVKVKIRVDKTGQYEDQNDISGFKPLGTAAPQPQQVMAATASVGGDPW
jgi:hypothetical protein